MLNAGKFIRYMDAYFLKQIFHTGRKTFKFFVCPKPGRVPGTCWTLINNGQKNKCSQVLRGKALAKITSINSKSLMPTLISSLIFIYEIVK